MIEIDGSYLEGGGQILRTALALSTITKKPFRITNIRKNRPNPGLKMQHLYGIKALEQICSAKHSGAVLGSQEVEFVPGEIKGGKVEVDMKTAGSITLLLQSLIIPCLFAPKPTRLKLTGGTDVVWSPSFDYFTNILVPHLQKYAKMDAIVQKRGFYPKGGGKVDIKIAPNEIMEKKLISLAEERNLLSIKIISLADKELQRANVAQRQAYAAKMMLAKYDVPIQIKEDYCECLNPGSVITIIANFGEDEIDLNNPIKLGADSIGERGKPSEKVGEDAAELIIKQIESNAPVDKFLADQILPFLAIFGGKIRVAEITDHVRTNIYTIEKFLDVKFKMEGNIIEINRS